tara:strand:- start:54 stop:185 length:132 start_codon:yes stop_codon:yes gene_type:complete
MGWDGGGKGWFAVERKQYSYTCIIRRETYYNQEKKIYWVLTKY